MIKSSDLFTSLDRENKAAIFIAVFFVIFLAVLRPNGLGYWFQYWWMFLVALVFSIIANTAGVSGSALFVPFFILLFPLLGDSLSPQTLLMVSLITESFGLMSAAFASIDYGLVDLKVGVFSILSAAPFVLAGAFLIFFVPETYFRLLVAGVLLLSAFLIREEIMNANRGKLVRADSGVEDIEKKDREGHTYHYSHTGSLKRYLSYSMGGVFQGAVGLGIGGLGITSMIYTGIPDKIAIGTSHIIVAFTALLASITHLFLSGSHLTAPWNIVMMTVPAAIIGGQLSPRIEEEAPDLELEELIQAVFLFIALALIVMVLL